MRIVRWAFVITIAFLLIEFPHNPNPSHVSWIQQYGSNISHDVSSLVTLSLGSTYDGLSAGQVTWTGLLSSLPLLGIAFVFTLVFGCTKGVYDGLYRHEAGRSVGKFLSGLLQLVSEAVPDFFIIFAIELLGFFLNRHGIKVYFVGEQNGQFFTGTVVPALVLCMVPTMYFARMIRIAVEEQRDQQYLLTAKAKGLLPKQVLLRHIIPNLAVTAKFTVPPVIGMLLSNLVLVEYLFFRNGLLANVLYAMGVVPGQEHPFDQHLILLCLMTAGVLCVLCTVAFRVGLTLTGLRVVANPYAAALRDGDGDQQRATRHLVIGALMLVFMLVLGLLAPHLSLPNPNHEEVVRIQGNDVSSPPFPPSSEHWLGTDLLGRDLLSRAIAGIYPTFSLVGLTVATAIFLSIILSLLSSVWKIRWVRWVVDTWSHGTTFVPGIVGCLIILTIPPVNQLGLHFVMHKQGRFEVATVQYWTKAHVVAMVATLAIFECGRMAYQLQQTLDGLEGASYMEASNIVGTTPYTTLVFHHRRTLFIAIVEQIIVSSTRVLLLTASLGFFQISFGQMKQYNPEQNEWIVSSTLHDWGGLFAENARDVLFYQWVMFAPALFVAWTTLGLNIMAQGVRELMWTQPAHRARAGTTLGMRLVTLWRPSAGQ